LVLPSKLGKQARAQGQLVSLLSQVYQLLYLEIKEQDMEKYRPKVDSLTYLVNDVRMNWQTNK